MRAQEIKAFYNDGKPVYKKGTKLFEKLCLNQ